MRLRDVFTYGLALLSTAVMLTGCGNGATGNGNPGGVGNPAGNGNTAAIQNTGAGTGDVKSNPNVYFLQSDVPPRIDIQGTETPYGTPPNFGTGTDYGRFIRPDAVSDYSGVDIGISENRR